MEKEFKNIQYKVETSRTFEQKKEDILNSSIEDYSYTIGFFGYDNSLKPEVLKENNLNYVKDFYAKDLYTKENIIYGLGLRNENNYQYRFPKDFIGAFFRGGKKAYEKYLNEEYDFYINHASKIVHYIVPDLKDTQYEDMKTGEEKSAWIKGKTSNFPYWHERSNENFSGLESFEFFRDEFITLLTINIIEKHPEWKNLDINERVRMMKILEKKELSSEEKEKIGFDSVTELAGDLSELVPKYGITESSVLKKISEFFKKNNFEISDLEKQKLTSSVTSAKLLKSIYSGLDDNIYDKPNQ